MKDGSLFLFLSLTCRASGGRHAAKEHSEPCPSPAPAKRTGAEGDTVRKKRSPQKKEVSLPALRQRPSLHLKPRSRAPPQKKKAWLRKLRAPDKRASGDGWNFADPQTGVAKGRTLGRNMRSKCRCSMCPAIHINSRSWLRSSSTHEPSDPPPKVVSFFFFSFQSGRASCSAHARGMRGELVASNRKIGKNEKAANRKTNKKSPGAAPVHEADGTL